MPRELMPVDNDYSDWIDQIALPDLVGEVGDLAEFLPYAKHVVGAYRWFRGWRVKQFLRALSKTAESMDDNAKVQLEAILKSKEGAEILADYVKAILHTSSKSAIAALALLYSDVNDESYSKNFKLSAVTAFEGISEHSIDAFLELSCVDSFIPKENQPNVPYPVAVANDGLIDRLNPPAKDLLRSPDSRVIIISDLIRRGLLLPDFATARWSDGGVGLTFGVSDEVTKYVELIQRARELHPPEE